MSIEVTWGDPARTIIHMVFEKGWQWSDLYHALQTADDWIVGEQHSVNVIIDLRRSGRLPGDFIKVASDIFAQGEARPNEGQRIIVGAGPLFRAAYHSFLTVYGHKLTDRPFRFAASMEDAHTMLSN